MRKIPIGIEDFKRIIVENYYYIDKTKFIEEIVDDGALVKLFTRPRRFGKTLNMSMLKYFFDIREKEENRKLFDGLYIENSSVIAEQGKYLVIFITMKDIKGNSLESLMDKFKTTISNLFVEYRYLREKLDERDIDVFDAIWKKQDTDYSDSLKFLSRILKEYYNENAIILIDEYDIPLISAYEHGYYDKAIELFKILYSSVLKTNPNLKMGVMTGAIRIAQAGIFSDLNNIETHTILDEEYDEYFGLSELEVEEALKEYGIEYDLEKVKLWYDGYRFGNMEIYNPWSILKYIKSNKLGAYWINTSGNMLIREVLKNSDKSVFDTLEGLFQKKDTMVYINESVAFDKNLLSNQIWELMLFSGYLTVKEELDNRTYLVRIPNKEIMTFFKELFIDIVFDGNMTVINEMKIALQIKDIEKIKQCIEKLVLSAMSFYDTDKRYENSYQTLLSGFFYALDGIYKLDSNKESGHGRPDLILEPLGKNKTAYILELKKAKTKNLKKEAAEALKQIEENGYDTDLKRKGITDIVKMGIVFDVKKVEFSC